MDFIQDLANVDWDAFELAKSGRSVKVLYKKNPLQFCTSTLYSPFGVKGVSKEWSVLTDYYIDCSLNQSASETSVLFKEFLEKLDEKINELVNDNEELFKDDVTDCTYTPILRVNGNYPKLFKLQLVRDRNGNFESFFFDESKNKIKVSEDNVEDVLSKGKNFKCIVECSKIWCYNGKIGSIWNIVQCKFSKQAYKSPGHSEPSTYQTLMIED